MNSSIVDKNMVPESLAGYDIEWHDANEEIFSLHGVYYEASEGRYRRMPAEAAARVSEPVAYRAPFTAGGRLRFATNSPFVAITANEPFTPVAGVSTQHVMKYGFSLYKNAGEYVGCCAPAIHSDVFCKEPFTYSAIFLTKQERKTNYTLHFPLYNGVNKLYIGIQRGAKLYAPKPYRYEKPVLFLGSSITQGASASRPGCEYVGILSRLCNTDIWNLGFSGSCKAEPEMAEYIASCDPSVFVYDYDHNAPNPEHLEKTHYALYKKFREAHPDTPVIMMSRPIYMEATGSPKRLAIIKASYERALAEGDKNVYFIDGRTLIGVRDQLHCTMDRTHPTDLGFYRMAKRVYPLLKKLLAEGEKK